MLLFTTESNYAGTVRAVQFVEVLAEEEGENRIDTTGEVTAVTRKTQRGSLLSSVVMVMLATVATALLAFIGFQALPDSVIPATFGGEDRTNRHVNVTESPAPDSAKPTVVPSTRPPFPSATANPNATVRSDPKPTRNGATSVRTTDAPNPVTATTSPPKPKPTATTTSPKPSPSASQTTQTASPAPTCGTGRKPRCPRSAEPAASTSSPARMASYGDASYGDYGVPTKSSTDAKKKAHRKQAVKAKARARR